MNIIVIGSGIAGLAAACREAAKGHDVIILEQRDSVGGKISVIKKDGFTWDGGPSFFTDPEELRTLFNDCGKKLEDYFSYFELEEACRYFYDDVVVKGYDTPKALATELHRAFGEPKQNTLRFLEDVNKLYTSAGQQFLNDPVTLKMLLSFETLDSLSNLPKKSVVSNLHEMHQKYFDTNQVVQFFDRFATYVGGNPYKTPGVLMAMPQLEHNDGAVQPKGGMRSIVRAVDKLAKDLGVRIELGARVGAVKVEQNRIVELKTNKGAYKPDIVIHAGDIAQFYKMTNQKRYKAHSKREHSLSGYVQYIGVKGKTKNLFLHNILFSDDYRAETEAIWKGEVYHDPTIYINNTSFYEKNDAPKNCENWFIMVNLPSGFDSAKLPELREIVLQKLEKYFPGFSKRIMTEADAMTPKSLEDNFIAFKGSIYGLAANSIRSAFLRPPNKDKDLSNVYHVGVTVHPGGGIPLALRSAKIVSKMID